MKIDTYTVTSEAYSKGRSINRRIKRQNEKIDEQAEGWRLTDWRQDAPAPAPVIVLNVDIDAQKLEVPHTMMRQFVGRRQARIVGSFDAVPDAVVESDQDE